MVGKLLVHAEIGTTERYAHLTDDPIRQANERIGGDHIWASFATGNMISSPSAARQRRLKGSLSAASPTTQPTRIG